MNANQDFRDLLCALNGAGVDFPTACRSGTEQQLVVDACT